MGRVLIRAELKMGESEGGRLSVGTTLPLMLCSVVPEHGQDRLSVFSLTASYLHPGRGGEHAKDFVLILAQHASLKWLLVYG